MVMDNPYQNKKVLVLGLARSGFYAAKLLQQLGAEITVNDAADLTEDEHAKELEAIGIQVISGGHPEDLMDEGFDLLVKNPGIPYHNKIIKQALELNIPIITEVEVATSVMKAHFIGITGTNGKTTTTSIIHEMLSANRAEGSAYAIGNIGVPASQVALDLEEADDVVMELSSFQLMGTPTIKPEIALITNVTSAHLDYHGSQAEYEEAKMNLLKNQTADDVVIYNDDDAHLKDLVHKHSRATLLPFSRTNYLADGISVKDGAIYFKQEKVAYVSDIFVKGKHNLENFLAAVGVAKLKGISNETIQQVMREFKGVKHRTQFVGEWNERVFYNDSKATNIEATQNALAGFSQPVILIAGGLDRGITFEELEPALKQHVKALVALGETKELIVKAASAAGIPLIETVNTMSEAVATAVAISQPGDVILLSPAAASWDQYKNFEERGDAYIQAIKDLIND